MEILQKLQALPPNVLPVVKLGLWLFALSLIFIPVERLFALRKQKIARAAALTDLVYYFLNNLLPKVLLAYPVFLLAWAAHAYLPWHIRQFVTDMPLWARLLATFVVGDLGFYWGHRWTHEIPFLWRFHAIHHSAEEIDWLVNTRAHPLDMVFTRLVGIVPIFVLGLATPIPTDDPRDLAPLLVALIGPWWGFFIHANLRWRFGWLEWVISTPAFHHWHHTNDAMRDRNYAAMLPFLDRLFGTYHVPKEWPQVYGVDKPVSPNLLWQLIDPLVPEPKPRAPKAVARRTAG